MYLSLTLDMVVMIVYGILLTYMLVGAVQGGAITETVEAINHLKDIAIQVITHDTVTVGGHTALTQQNFWNAWCKSCN